MDHHFSGGSWMMVPTQSSMPQDQSSFQPQYYQQQRQHQQLQQQLHQQQQDNLHHQSLASHFHLLHGRSSDGAVWPVVILHSVAAMWCLLVVKLATKYVSVVGDLGMKRDELQIASNGWNFYNGADTELVERLAESVESGNRDQHSEALINELSNHFDKCQQLLNSISGSISSKAVTVEGQKRKQEDTMQLLNQRKDLIAKYRNSVEELVNADRNR